MIVAWVADFRMTLDGWNYNNFSGNKWQNVKSEERRLYLKNAYRVLLTHVRQGMFIFISEGSDVDNARPREFYYGTYNYLRELGIRNLLEYENKWKPYKEGCYNGKRQTC